MLEEASRLTREVAEASRRAGMPDAASGPRWLGAMADLSVVAAAVGHADAAARLTGALGPYQGRLVVWGGANSAWGPVSHYLGLLAAALGKAGEAVRHFLDSHETIFVVEQNRDAQLRSLLTIETGVPRDRLTPILDYGGLPLTAERVTGDVARHREASVA